MIARAGERAPFLPYVHSFRALVIVGVVASHLDLAWPSSSLTGRLVQSLAQNSSAMFLFVAGFLFQHLSTGFAYGKYLKSKTWNVIIPYVVISLPALLYQFQRQVGVFGPHYPSHHFANPFVQGAAALLIAGHMPAPMWFVPAISVIYLAAPLLIGIDRRPRLYWITIPWLLAAMLCHRPLPVNRIEQALIYFTPAYLAGMWFSRHRERVMRFVDDNLSVLFGIFVALELLSVVVLQRPGALFSHTPFSLEGGLFDLNLPNKLLLSLALIGLLARYETAVGDKLSYLASASFGVFFVHQYVIQVVQLIAGKQLHREIQGTVGNALVLVPFYTIMSLALVALVRAMAGKRSRYIVGC